MKATAGSWLCQCIDAGRKVQMQKRKRNNGHCCSSTWGFVFRPVLRLRQSLRQNLSGRTETVLVDHILGGGVTLLLLAYLTYALIRPERF